MSRDIQEAVEAALETLRDSRNRDRVTEIYCESRRVAKGESDKTERGENQRKQILKLKGKRESRWDFFFIALIHLNWVRRVVFFNYTSCSDRLACSIASIYLCDSEVV